MKTALDPRHQKRIDRMQQVFSLTFNNGKTDHEVDVISKEFPGIDEMIRISAPEWPTDKIAKIDLAILRLAIFELTIEKKEPPKVIIDEAVELAKEFGNDNSQKFVNGVLGTILKNMQS